MCDGKRVSNYFRASAKLAKKRPKKGQMKANMAKKRPKKDQIKANMAKKKAKKGPKNQARVWAVRLWVVFGSGFFLFGPVAPWVLVSSADSFFFAARFCFG